MGLLTENSINKLLSRGRKAIALKFAKKVDIAITNIIADKISEMQ